MPPTGNSVEEPCVYILDNDGFFYDKNGNEMRPGDRVRADVDHISSNGTLMCGDEGVLLGSNGLKSVCVRWDDFVISGHNCGGRCDKGHGWNVSPDELICLSERCTLVSSDEDAVDFFCSNL